jgi:L-xylulokinase
MSDYLMGIDNGGTLSKAVIFDSAGRQVAAAARQVPLILPEPGHTERDMEVLWLANVQAILDVLAMARNVPGFQPERIRGMACTGHGSGLYLWGMDGRPAWNGIVSTDTRAWRQVQAWQDDGTAARVRERTCQSILTCQPAGLLRWFMEHHPEVLDRTLWIFAVKDYIRYRLTGVALSESSDYSGAGLMNLREASFDRSLLVDYGLESLYDRLPPLRRSTDCCGTLTPEAASLTGLPPGIPLAGGMFDINACAVACGVTDSTNLCVIAGTWGINEYVSPSPVLDGSIMMNSLFCLPDLYLVEESSPTSAGNYEWFTKLFLDSERRQAADRGITLYELAAEMAAAVPADGQDIVFLPYIFGSNYNPRAKACFIGLEAGHSRAQLIRAVLEGIVFCHRVHVDKLLLNRPRSGAIRLAGGAAKSALWAQLFADILGFPVELVEASELGTLGCAMAAAVVAGLYPDLRAAAVGMSAVSQRLEPDGSLAAIYQRKYLRYLRVAAALDPLWEGWMEP